MDLFLHDILTYNFADILFNDPSASIFATYAVHKIREFFRQWFGEINLSEKSMVDGRFIYT